MTSKPNTPPRILITDFVWPTTQPERAVLAEINADVVEAPAATLAALTVYCDGIMTCFAQVTPAVVRAAERCRVMSRYDVKALTEELLNKGVELAGPIESFTGSNGDIRSIYVYDPDGHPCPVQYAVAAGAFSTSSDFRSW